MVPSTRPQSNKVSCPAGPAKPGGELRTGKITGNFCDLRPFSALSAGSWRPFTLQFRCVADDSLFCTEQGNCFMETGNSSVGNRELSYLIPNLSSPSNRALNFSLKLISRLN